MGGNLHWRQQLPLFRQELFLQFFGLLVHFATLMVSRPLWTDRFRSGIRLVVLFHNYVSSHPSVVISFICETARRWCIHGIGRFCPRGGFLHLRVWISHLPHSHRTVDN